MASSSTSSRGESGIPLNNLEDKLEPNEQSDSYISLTSDAVAHMNDDPLPHSKEASSVTTEGEEGNVVEMPTVPHGLTADDTLMNITSTSEGTYSYLYFNNYMMEFYVL